MPRLFDTHVLRWRSYKAVHFLVLVVLVLFSAFEVGGVVSAVLCLCIAGVLALASRQPDVLIPPVAFIAVAYAMGFAMPILWPGMYPRLWGQIPQEALDLGMLWAVRGFGAFALAYATAGRLSRQIRARRVPKAWRSRSRVEYTVYVLKVVGWLALLAWVASVMLFGISLTFIAGDPGGVDQGEGTLLQVFTLLSSLRYGFFLGFGALYLAKGPVKELRLLFLALLFVSAVEIVTIGSKGSSIIVLVSFMLALAIVPSKPSLKQLVAGALALVVVYGAFAVTTEYRDLMLNRSRWGEDVFSFSVQAEAFGTALLRSLPFSEAQDERGSQVDQSTVLSRLGSGIFSFSNLLSYTGGQSPHEHKWESFLIPIYAVVPRALMPAKPEFFDSGRNATEYYGWRYGGISVTLLGSLYYAWGYPGIIFGMAFFGGVLAYAARRARTLGVYSPHSLVLLVVLSLPIMDVGVTFHAISTNAVRVLLLLWLLHRLYPAVRRATRRRVQQDRFRFQPGPRS